MKKIFALLSLSPSFPAGFAQDTNSQMAAVKNPAIIPVTRGNPTNWLARHEGFVKEAKAGGIDILFMGDSITDNWRNRRGKNVWDKVYAPRQRRYSALGGDRMPQHVIWRIEHGELDGLDPKVIVLMIGTNNSNTDSPDQISEGVEKIVSETRAKCPKSKILLLAIFPRSRAGDKPVQMETIHKVNEHSPGWTMAKTFSSWTSTRCFLATTGRFPRRSCRIFCIQMNTEYQLWADAMEPTLDKMLK